MSASAQIALVLGMHRSGTSALAGLVAELGFDVGKNLLPGNEFNEKGYYENEAIVNFHSRALEELHSSWHDLRILPDDAFRGNWLDDKVMELSSVLQTQFGSSRRIVVKDPRTIRLFPIWKRFASETGVNLTYLLIGRHPLEVCYSLGHRDGFSRQKSLLLWLQHNLLAECYTRSDKRLILTYQDLIARPDAKGREIGAFLGIEQEASLGKAAATIEPSIVHHIANDETWCEQPDLRRWTNETWRSLFQPHSGNAATAKRLDGIHHELARSLDLFPEEATGLGDYRAAATERELRRKEKNYQSLQERYQEQNRSLEKVMRERDETRAQAAEKYQEQKETLRKVMIERDEIRAQAAEKYQEQKETLRKVMIERDEIRAQTAKKYQEQKETLRKVMIERDEIRAQTAKKFQAKEKALRKILLERDELRKESAAEKQQVLKLQAQLDDLRLSVKQKGVLEAELDRAAKQVVVKQGRLDRLERELENLRHKWTALPIRRRLKKLAAGHTSLKLTSLNAVTPGAWNVSCSGFHFAAAIFPDVSHSGEFSIAGWIVGNTESPPQVRIVNDSARYQAKRGKKRIDVPLLFPQDKRATQSGFAILGIKDGLQNKYRLEVRRPPGEWIAVATIDFSAAGWHHFRDIYEIVGSGLFDASWYAKRHGLSGLTQEALISDYLREGAAAGRYPNPLFSTTYYVNSNPDVCATGENPLLEYIRASRSGEPRQPNRWFDPVWYLEQNKDVVPARLDPLVHYLRYGSADKRNPGPKFDVAAYLNKNPDVQQSGLDALSHFLHYGTAEGREASSPDELVKWVYDRGKIDTNKLNVLLVGHVLGKALFGSERSLLDLIQLIDQERFNIFCCFPQFAPGFFDAIKPFVAGIAVFPYEWWRGFAAGSDGFDRQFEEILRSRRIGLVHVNSLVLRDPLIAAKRLGIPSILHLREIIRLDPDLAERIGLPAETIAEKASTMSDFIIANSNVTRTQCGDPERSLVLYNTVDSPELNLALRQRDGQLRVAMVSSNIPKKGLDDFFAIARRAHEQSDPLSFWLVGPDNNWVKEHVEKETCPPNVHRTGYVERPEEILREIDVIVNLSTFAESFGRSVGEGMLARRPAVVYERGALPELIRDGIDGFVVPFRDVDQVLDRLNRLAQDPALVAKMGESAHERAKAMFSRAAGAETLRQIYDQVLSSVSTSAAIAKTGVAQKNALSTRKMRIGYFQWHFPVPSETFVLNELRDFLALGHDVRVFCRQSPFKDFAPDFPVQWQHVQSPDELAAAISDTKREIMHSHFVYPTVTEFLWPACEKAGVPFTFIAHAQDIFRHSNQAQNRIGEIARSPLCRAVFAPGRFHERLFLEQGVPSEKIIINPQSIPVNFFCFANSRSHEKAQRSVCAIHRFVEKKGLQHAVRAAAKLAEHGISLHLYGYGPLEEPLKALSAELRLTNVHFAGPLTERAEVVKTLHEHDLFLCPSLRAEDGDMDGIPTVLMEAMACGTPVVASGVSSIPDLVQEGVTGYICDPDNTDSLAHAILRFYSDPIAKIDSIVRRARETVETHYDIHKAIRTLERVWMGEGVDIVLVTLNNLPELKEVVARIFRFTANPFQLFIVDNGSDEQTRNYIVSLERIHSNVRALFLDRNVFVGPATNRGIELGTAKFIVYLCAREGFIMSRDWDHQIVRYMEAHPEVGLAGTLAHSPSYLSGRDYASNLEAFPQFRNKQYASAKSDRVFKHVQGGLLVIRRSMFEQIGGFSEQVPHRHTDVEYSYYAESCGWKLGSVPDVAAYYKAARPELTAHLTERIQALHPGSLETAPLLEKIASRETEFCNVCAQAVAFTLTEAGLICPLCGAEPFHRTLYRYIAESVLPYRRLPALCISSASGLTPIWNKMFQGRYASYDDIVREIEEGGKIDHASAGRDLIVLQVPRPIPAPSRKLLQEIQRILKPAGTLIYTQAYGVGSILKPDETGFPRTSDEVTALLESSGFLVESRINFASTAVRYLDWDVFQCSKSDTPAVEAALSA